MPPTLTALLDAIEYMKRVDGSPEFYDARAARNDAEDKWFEAGCPREVRPVSSTCPHTDTRSGWNPSQPHICNDCGSEL
jgi:hypothetical protein